MEEKMDEAAQDAAARAAKADHDRVRGLPVKGYAPTQSALGVATVSTLKELEERVLRCTEHMEALNAGGQLSVDGRLLAIGRTQLQGAFMFLARAVFQPGRVALPEDEADESKGDYGQAPGNG